MTEKKNGIVNGYNALILALVTFCGTLVVDREKMETRVAELEREVRVLIKEKQIVEFSAFQLEFRLLEAFSQVDVMQSFIDAMPIPAWIKKRRSDGEFEVVIINNAFVRKFDITKMQYEKKTDYEFWPKAIADGYRASDNKVYNSKRATCLHEDTGKKEKELVCKFPIMLEDRRLGVAGIILVDPIIKSIVSRILSSKSFFI